MNKKAKNIIAKVLIGGAMALTVTGVGLVGNNAEAAVNAGDFDFYYNEDHNKIQVQSWYYDHGCNFRFKYEREETGFIHLSEGLRHCGVNKDIELAKDFPDVIYNGAKSQNYDNMTLTRDNDGFLILTVGANEIYLNSVTATFYASDGYHYWYRNTNTVPGPYLGAGFTVDVK